MKSIRLLLLTKLAVAATVGLLFARAIGLSSIDSLVSGVVHVWVLVGMAHLSCVKVP